MKFKGKFCLLFLTLFALQMLSCDGGKADKAAVVLTDTANKDTIQHPAAIQQVKEESIPYFTNDEFVEKVDNFLEQKIRTDILNASQFSVSHITEANRYEGGITDTLISINSAEGDSLTVWKSGKEDKIFIIRALINSAAVPIPDLQIGMSKAEVEALFDISITNNGQVKIGVLERLSWIRLIFDKNTLTGMEFINMAE
jgi:hypothetical protein